MPLANSTGPSWSKVVRDEVERRTSLRGMLARWIAQFFGPPRAVKRLTPPTPIEGARKARKASRTGRSIVTGTERPGPDE
jgi:hypothetical protein